MIETGVLTGVFGGFAQACAGSNVVFFSVKYRVYAFKTRLNILILA